MLLNLRLKMNRYLFEAYENGNRGKIFLGYRSVLASTKEEAVTSLLDKQKDIQLCQVYFDDSK